MLFDFFKKSAGPIGVDICKDAVRMAQFKTVDGKMQLLAGGTEPLSAAVEPYSGQWQRTVVEVIKSIYASAPFKSRNVVTTIQSSDVFTKEITIRPEDTEKTNQIVTDEVKKIIPFTIEEALIKRIELTNEGFQDDSRSILVMATERRKVERHLAIFEKASMPVKSVTVLPIILTGAYCRLFGRRAADANVNVMLLHVQQSCCNVVVCKGSKIHFARNITKGIEDLKTLKGKKHFIDEIDACLRYFQSGTHLSVVEKIILFANEHVDKELSDAVTAIAKNHSIPAHVGDVVKAISDDNVFQKGIDARDPNKDWTISFALAMTGGDLYTLKGSEFSH